MKAYRLYGISDLRYTDTDMPELPSGWALIKVKACGICSSDIPRIFVKGTYYFPTIPGHEFSGVVANVADKKDAMLIGKRVAVFPLIPCNKCEQCKKKHYEMCEHYGYLGSRCDGGMAEYVAAPVWNLIELPDDIDFEVGALFEPLAVALHCIKKAELCKGESLAVIGSGTIAFAVAQWAKIGGAKSVCIFGRSENKRSVAERCGLIYKTVDETADKHFDVTIEAVGTSAALSTALGLANAGGKVVLMGNPSSDISLKQDVYWQILRKQLRVIGTWNSVYDGKNQSEWYEVLNAVSSGKLDVKPLISHYFDQDKLAEGLRIMHEHKEPYCKVMTLWGTDDETGDKNE